MKAELVRILLPLLLCMTSPGAVLAGEAVDSSRPVNSTSHEVALQSGLHWIDWLIVVAYATGMLILGYCFSKKQTNIGEYFVGGGQMRSSSIGISLFVTLLSTISYLSQPGEIINNGPVILTGLLAIPLVYCVVGYLLIPVYMRERVTSGYELLEARLGTGIRRLGASMFVLLRLVWMSLMIYLTSEALVAMLGLEEEQRFLVALGIGIVAITYTSLGGLRAVVITDVCQFFLLLGGAIATVLLITIWVGGISAWWPTSWATHWDVQPLFSLDPHVRVTVVGSMVAAAVWHISTAGGDQTAIQRYMATRDAAAARRAYLFSSVGEITVSITLTLVGLALLGYFQAYPELIPRSGGLETEADYLFPHYIAYYLPVGFSGLVVAGLFAAAMSSIDSGVNSITAVVMTDFLAPIGLRLQREKDHIRVARLLAFGIGAVVVQASSLMRYVPGNFLEMTQKTTNLLAPLIFVLFLLALFVPFSTPLGAFVGVAYGFATALLVAFWDLITEGEPLSFQWIGISSFLVALLVSCLVSRFGPKPEDRKASLLTAAVALALLAAGLWVVVC